MSGGFRVIGGSFHSFALFRLRYHTLATRAAGTVELLAGTGPPVQPLMASDLTQESSASFRLSLFSGLDEVREEPKRARKKSVKST